MYYRTGTFVLLRRTARPNLVDGEPELYDEPDETMCDLGNRRLTPK